MANRLTLVDLAKRTGNDRQVGLIEAMTQSNGLLERLPFKTINGISYKVKTRTALPSVGTRAFNQGITETKSTIKQTTYETKIFNSRSIVDVLEADTYPEGAAALRNEEDRSHLYAMGNKFNYYAYYGNGSTDPTVFDGLATILNSTAVSTVRGATGASGSSTSLYFVSFASANTTQGIVKGVEGVVTSGQELSAVDKGQVLVNDLDSAQYWAYVTEIQAMYGLAVYDTRAAGRYYGITSSISPTIANIDAIITSMYPFGCDAIFCNKTGWNALKGLKSTITYYPQDTEIKKSVLTYDGIPIILDENILDTETYG